MLRIGMGRIKRYKYLTQIIRRNADPIIFNGNLNPAVQQTEPDLQMLVRHVQPWQK